MTENHIPLRKAALRDAILADAALSHGERESFRQLFRLLDATVHHAYHSRLEDLKASYAAFDPDVDGVPVTPLVGEERQSRADEFFAKFSELLTRANFRRLDDESLLEAVDQASGLGMNLDVDFGVFQRLDVYVRGSQVVCKELPGLWNTLRRKQIELPVYSRLVVVFQLQNHRRLPKPVDTNTIFLKFFKDIPKPDVEMLLPGTRVRMSWFDQSKIMAPTLSGIGLTLYKVITGALIFSFAGVYGILASIGVIGGTLGYGAKSFYSYLNTKDKYSLSLTRSLYYQKLDSNAGVLHRLLDEAEEQELREAMLAYYLLWKNAGDEGWSTEELDRAAEELVLELTKQDVDFEITDALDKLVRMKLVQSLPERHWRAVDLDHAQAVLDAAWDAQFHAKPRREQIKLPHFERITPPETPVNSDDWGPVL